MARLLISFCNVSPTGLALGAYDFDAERFAWVDLSGICTNCVGVDGICRREDGYWVLLQVAHGGISGLARVRPDLRADRCYRLSETRDAHSLIAYKGGFLVNDTTHNRLNFVTVPDTGDAVQETEFWRSRDERTDAVHLNSVAVLEGDIFVSVFGPKPAAGWLDSKDGQVINISRNQVLCDGLNHPHSLISFDGSLYWLESRRGILHRYSPRTGRETVLSLSGYLRGLACDGRFLYIGASARRRRSRSTGVPSIPAAECPDELQSWIYRVDCKSLEVQRRQLTLWGAEVFDLLVVDAADILDAPGFANAAVVQRIWRCEEELLQLRDEREACNVALQSILRRLIDDKEYARALPVLEELCQEHPGNAEWHYHLAYCLHLLGQDRQRARGLYDVALTGGFEEFSIHFHRGSLLFEMGELEAARADLERACALRPEHTGAASLLNDIWNALIRGKMERKDHGKALELLAPLRRREPSHPWWNYLTALALHLQGRNLSEALKFYDLALQHTPELDAEEFWIRYNRGALLHRLGKRDLALVDLERAIQLQPSHAGAQELLRELTSRR